MRRLAAALRRGLAPVVRVPAGADGRSLAGVTARVPW